MSRIAYYGTDSTGHIAVTGVCNDTDLSLQSMPGITYAQGTGSENPATQYLLAGAITARPACPVSASVSGRVVTLSGVPSGAAYAISGDATSSGTADSSGTLTLTFTAAGSYVVAVPCFPAIDYSGSFTLT